MRFPNNRLKSKIKSRVLIFDRTVLHLGHWPLSMPEYKERIFHHAGLPLWSGIPAAVRIQTFSVRMVLFWSGFGQKVWILTKLYQMSMYLKTFYT